MYEIDMKCQKCKNNGTAICNRCDMFYDEFDPIDKPPKTNYDCIISKTPEELAKWLWFKVGKCPPFDVCPSQCIPCEAEDCWLDWLRQEAEEEIK